MTRKHPNSGGKTDPASNPELQQAAKTDFNGDVAGLLGLKMLRPLTEFPISTQPISEHLRSLGYGWYLLVGTRCLEDDVPADTVRTCMLVWARDPGGALIVGGYAVTEDYKNAAAANELPLAEALVTASGWTYGELVRAEHGRVMEEAVYGSTGDFLFKELLFPKARVCFRSRARKEAELPFAIRLVGEKGGR